MVFLFWIKDVPKMQMISIKKFQPPQKSQFAYNSGRRNNKFEFCYSQI